MTRGLACVLLPALWLAGCAGGPAPRPEQLARAWETHQARVSGLAEWALAGRIAVTADDGNWNGKLHWRQAGRRFLLSFELPMGIGAAQLRSRPGGGGVEMRISDGRQFQAADVESLVQRFIGMRLPVSGLRYWVTGLPQPGLPASREYDGAGRLARLQQSGWDIRYRGYVTENGVDLPRRLSIENERVNVRLLVDRWRVRA